jgi:hypothetical protein
MKPVGKGRSHQQSEDVVNTSKTFITALLLVTITVLSVGQTDAHAWGRRGRWGWGGRGLFAVAATTAIIAAASRPRVVVAQPVVTAPPPTSYVDPAGRLVIVRTVYDPAVGRYVQYSEYAQ